MGRQLFQNGRYIGPVPTAGSPGEPPRPIQPLPRATVPRPVYLPQAIRAAEAVGQSLVAEYGQVEWIAQVQEGVARLVNTAVQQWSGIAPPSGNAIPLAAGGAYTHEPITEVGVQEHLKANPAAHQGNVAAPQDPRVVARAQAAHQAQQPQQFAEIAGVLDPMDPGRPPDEDGGTVPVLW